MKYTYTLAALAAVASAHDFTSFYNLTLSTNDILSKAGLTVPGPLGAGGLCNIAIDTKTETICYAIQMDGIMGMFKPTGKSSTHLSSGPKGEIGVPRIAFPDALGEGVSRMTSGCMTGPFETGILGLDGLDTGLGFKLAEIEANPAAFFLGAATDSFPEGVLKGQMDQSVQTDKSVADGQVPHKAAITFPIPKWCPIPHSCENNTITFNDFQVKESPNNSGKENLHTAESSKKVDDGLLSDIGNGSLDNVNLGPNLPTVEVPKLADGLNVSVPPNALHENMVDQKDGDGLNLSVLPNSLQDSLNDNKIGHNDGDGLNLSALPNTLDNSLSGNKVGTGVLGPVAPATGGAHSLEQAPAAMAGPASAEKASTEDDSHVKEPEHAYPETTCTEEEYATTKKAEYPATTKEAHYPVTTKKAEYPATKKDDGHEITTHTYTKTEEITISKCAPTVTDCPYKHNPVVTKTENVYTTVCPKSEVPYQTAYPHKPTDKQVYETKTYVVTVSQPGKYETKTITTTYPVHTVYKTVVPEKPTETPEAPIYPPGKPDRPATYPPKPEGPATYPPKPEGPATYPPKQPEGPATYPPKQPEGPATYPAGKPTYPVQPPTVVKTYQPTGTGAAPYKPYQTFTGAAPSNKVGGLLIAAGLAVALM